MSGPDALLTRPNGEPFEIHQDSLENVWSSESYRAVRRDLLEGRRPEVCKKCWREEDAGLTSYRMMSNRSRMFDYEAKEDPPFKVRYLDLRLGNVCNLKCRTCNPVSSSSWIGEWREVQNLAKLTGDGEVFDAEGFSKLRNIAWPDDQRTLENLKTIAPSLEQIYLTGGEPTLIPKQFEFLDYLIDQGFAARIELNYHTNLTKIHPRLIEYWRQFKHVHLNCSVDAVGELNDYIRHPSHWPTLDKNLRALKNLNFLSLDLSSTIQVYNIFHLIPLFSYAEELGIKANIILVHQPRCFSIKTLPLMLKEKAAEQLASHDFGDLIENYAGITDFMFSEDWSEYLPELISVTNKIDHLRKQNVLNHAPELAYLFARQGDLTAVGK